jgi:hypothetical protein
MYLFDIETLDSESTAVVLSAALVYVNEGDDYETIVNNSLFVKFNSKLQAQKYNRSISKETLDWWDKIHPAIRSASFDPHPDDLTPDEGIWALREYIRKHGDATAWSRGSFDQMIIDSLCKKVGVDLLFPYNNWRDVRTAVDCMCSTSKNGYCDINHPTFKRHNVIKHHPVHDCAYDAMMLLYGV